jgi:hypothetical protein
MEANIVDEMNDNISANSNKECQINKDEIRECCLSIFLNFAKIKNKNEFILPYIDLLKILKLAGIIGKCLQQNDIDIVLKTVSPGLSLSFDQFLNFIVQLSNRIYPDDFKANSKECIIQTVKNYLNPVYSYIQSKDGRFYPTTDIQNKITALQFDNNVLFILNTMYSSLCHLYKAYFYYENCNNYYPGIKSYSFSSLLEFCKEFKIIPFIATTEVIGIMYHIISEMTQEDITKNGVIYEEEYDLGVCFKLSHFVALLTHLAVTSFERYDKYLDLEGKNLEFNALDIPSKLILFFHKLQNESDNLKTTKSLSSKFFTLPSKEVIEKVISF